jgi:hypothetical protein
VNEPVPVPSVVLELTVVGFCVVLQQTPREVTGDPPSDMTVPPHIAELSVIALIEAVVTIGMPAMVIKLTSLP